MSALTVIFTGLLAFVGAILGHFVAFDLNAAARRRETRRAQAERLGQLLAEDITWTSTYRRQQLFGPGAAPEGSPFDQAHAIYVLYFANEIKDEMLELLKSRAAYIGAIDEGHVERLKIAKSKEEFEVTAPSGDSLRKVGTASGPYHKATFKSLSEAAKIIEACMPEDSELRRLWARLTGRQ